MEETLGLAEEEADVEGGFENVDVAEEVENVDVGEEAEEVDRLDDPTPISDGDSGEKGGPEEGLDNNEDGDDAAREEVTRAQQVEEDKDKVSDQLETDDEDDQVPQKLAKGPRRSKRLRNFFSKVLRRARS